MSNIDEHHDYQSVGKAVDVHLLRRLLPYARPQMGALMLGLILLFLLTGLEVIGPWLIKLAVDGPVRAAGEAATNPGEGSWTDAGRAAFIQDVLRLAGLYALCMTATFVFRLWQFMVLQRAGQRILHRIRHVTFSHLQRLPISFYDRNQSGRLVSRVTSDVETLNELFTSGLITLAGDILKVCVLTVVIFTIHPKLAIAVAAAVPVIAFASAWFRIRARRAYRATRSAIAQVNSYLGESVAGIRVLQAFSREDRAAAEFGKRNRLYRDTNLKTVVYFALFFPVVDWITYATQGTVFWLGGIEIMGQRLTAGEFIQFWYYLQFIFEPLRELAEKYNVLQSAMASAERIFGLLDEPPEVDGTKNLVPADAIEGDVLFRDVLFSYNEKEPVLRGITLAIPKGKTIALVGATGSGKTTLAALLLRLYEPQSGSIEIDGVPVERYARSSIRSRIAYVPQDVFLFRGSILENLKLSSTNLSDADVISAAEAIGADRWINRLPNRYEHILDDRGANLSTGERQMLAFARALASNPAILILDEATSNVDTQTEQRIQQAIDVLLRGRTALVIAHRLSTIRRADRVAVMHRGELREEGTHRELVAADGIYRRLHQLQFQ